MVTDQRDQETALVCEALVREINNARRWSAVLDAWMALGHVRRMSDEMAREREHVTGSGASRQ